MQSENDRLVRLRNNRETQGLVRDTPRPGRSPRLCQERDRLELGTSPV